MPKRIAVLATVTIACGGGGGTNPKTYDNVAGAYLGVASSVSQGVTLNATFSITVSQSAGTLGGTYTLVGTLSDSVSTVAAEGAGSLKGTITTGNNPSLSVTATNSNCPGLGTDFSGTYDDATHVITVKGTVIIINPVTCQTILSFQNTTIVYDTAPSTPKAVVKTVNMRPESTRVFVGDSVLVIALPLDSTGQAITGSRAGPSSWSVSDTGQLSLGSFPSGFGPSTAPSAIWVRAKRPLNSTITATYNGVTGTALVTVYPNLVGTWVGPTSELEDTSTVQNAQCPFGPGTLTMHFHDQVELTPVSSLVDSSVYFDVQIPSCAAQIHGGIYNQNPGGLNPLFLDVESQGERLYLYGALSGQRQAKGTACNVSVVFTAEIKISPDSLLGTYSGNDDCGRSITSGHFQLTR